MTTSSPAPPDPHQTPDVSNASGSSLVRGRSRWRRWLVRFTFATVVLVAGLLVARVVLFQGPYQRVEALPSTPLVDWHCHTAGLGAGNSGCFVADRLRTSWKFDFYLRAFGATRAEVEEQGDAFVVDRIAARLQESRHVGQAVILAMDGVIDERGELDRARTEVYVPDEFVARETARHPNLLFGASVNPRRPDALARLEWAATNGAVLVKWIPSIMDIDPADPRLEAFYRRLVELELPLLTHTGQERSFTGAHDEYGDPERLELPLRLGVTVIAAHVASTGMIEDEPQFDRLRRMMARHPNLLSEISSLTQINKLGYLRDTLKTPEFRGRLLYGTDFPLINMPLVSPWFFPLNLTFGQMREIASIRNPWDRDVRLKQALGVPAGVFAARPMAPLQDKLPLLEVVRDGFGSRLDRRR